MKRPNIVYVHSHDTGRYVQPYGFAVPTPRLQELADEGVRFRHAFCAAPTCSPSRAALLTGQWPHQAGMLGLVGCGWQLDDPSRHLVHTLRQAGYESTLIGFQHVMKDPHAIGYDRVIKPDRHFYTDEITEAAVEFLREPHEQPFFLSVGYFVTHRPFASAAEHEQLESTAGGVQPPLPLPDTPTIRGDMAAFHRQAAALDGGVGAILDALDDAGLADDTLVIFTTDHGIAFPLIKCNLTDHGLAVAMIMRGPAGSDLRGGHIVETMVSHVDVFPTLCQLLELEPPSWLVGRSFLPAVRGETDEIRDELFGEVTYHAAYEPQRCVRTRRYKYIRRYDDRETPVLPNVDGSPSKQAMVAAGWREQPRPKEMLFDLMFDPVETHNLAGDPRMVTVLDEMRGRLDRWMQQTQDPLLAGKPPVPEGGREDDPDEYAPWIERERGPYRDPPAGVDWR